MGINVTVNRKIVVNGKEYGSLEEMPEDLRRAYKRAIGAGHGAAGLAGSASKIVFQGKEYGTPAEMPAEARKFFDLAIAASRLEKSHPAEATVGAKPAGLIEHDGVFVPAPAKPGAPGSDRTWAIHLTIARGGLLLLALLVALAFALYW